MATTINGLYTTVQNVSGGTLIFGFLPPHGQKLTNNGTYSVFGDLTERLTNGGRLNVRKQKGLESSLLNTKLVILSTPQSLIRDAFPVSLANPSVALTQANTGGTVTALPTGNYRAVYTFVNNDGETTIGTSESSQFSLTNGTSLPRVTVPALPTGATSINIYLTAAGGASGTERLYATGVTTTTYDLVSASYFNGSVTFANAAAVPASNTTTSTVRALAISKGVIGGVDPTWGPTTV